MQKQKDMVCPKCASVEDQLSNLSPHRCKKKWKISQDMIIEWSPGYGIGEKKNQGRRKYI